MMNTRQKRQWLIVSVRDSMDHGVNDEITP